MAKRHTVGCANCKTTKRVLYRELTKTYCSRCGRLMSRAQVGEPARMRCERCGANQQVLDANKPDLKCLSCGAKMTAAMVVGAADARLPRRPAAKPKAVASRPGKAAAKPAPATATGGTASTQVADLVCPRCDRAYRGLRANDERCLNPRCRKARLVPASALPGRKAWEREKSGGGGPGTGKRR